MISNSSQVDLLGTPSLARSAACEWHKPSFLSRCGLKKTMSAAFEWRDLNSIGSGAYLLNFQSCFVFKCVLFSAPCIVLTLRLDNDEEPG